MSKIRRYLSSNAIVEFNQCECNTPLLEKCLFIVFAV